MSVNAIQRLEPEWWERLAERAALWRRDHPAAWSALAILRLVLGWLAVLGLLGSLVFVPEVRISALKSLTFLVPLVILFWLARTKTVRWRLVTAVFSASIAGALLIGLLSFTVGGFVLGGPNADGPAVAIASHFEEVGKLIPLALLAGFAPGRVRRLAAADWFVLGYASGAGFLVAEEGARAIQYANDPGLAAVHQALQGSITDPALFLDPFTVAVLGQGAALPIAHPVATAVVAGSIGIAIAAWRAWGPRRRWWAVALPLFAMALVISNHAIANASGSDLAALVGAEGLPVPLTLLWFLTGRGYSMPWIALAVFIACLALDVARRRSTGGQFPGLLLPPAAARQSRIEAWAQGKPWPAAVVALVASAGLQWWSDARLSLGGYPKRPGESRRAAVQRGRRGTEAAIRARQLAMRLTTPDDTVAARKRFRSFTIVVAAVAVAYAVVVGITMESVIGTGLTVPGDSDWPWHHLGGLFAYLENWWNGLPWWEHTLLAAGLVGLLWFYGLPLGLALARTGYTTYALGHSVEARKFAKDPGGSIGHYLFTRSPADMLGDGLEFDLTFTPGALGIEGTAGDLTSFVLGDKAVDAVRDLPGLDGSIADEFALRRRFDALGIDIHSLQPGAEYSRDGIVYGIDDHGLLWIRDAR